MFHVKHLVNDRRAVLPEPEKSATRRSYDNVAHHYAEEIADELDGKPLDRALLGLMAELSGAGLVADIGCGPGHVAAHLRAQSVTTIGLDLSSAMCTIGRRRTSLPFAAGDMTALPLATDSLAGIVCFYAVIHLEGAARLRAYREFARTLQPGGHALVAFHISDEDVSIGGVRRFSEWWGIEVSLTFRFLDPSEEVSLLKAAGLHVIAQLVREPYTGTEHPSKRCYLLAQRPPD
jgi:SAM-dependent methyltransferase